MGTLDSTIKGAGRLSADPQVVKTLLMQSQGFGIPGGNTSYLKAMGNLEQGVYGKGGAQNLMKMVNRVKGMGGNTEQQAATLSAMTSGKMNQSVSASLLEVISKGGSKGDMLKSIEAITKENKPINEKLLDNSGESLKVARRVAHLDNRLLDIGTAAAADIESIQDSMLEVADALMPAALATLSLIADGIHILVSNIPGSGDMELGAKANVAAAAASKFYRKYKRGTGGLEESDRAAFIERANKASTNMGTVLQARERGLLANLGPQEAQRFRTEQAIAHREAALAGEGAPMGLVGSMARRAVLGQQLRSHRGTPGGINGDTGREFMEAAIREQYFTSHNNTNITEADLASRMLIARAQIEARANQHAALLDMSIYRSVGSAVQPTTEPASRVE
jgi:hypothetical protein